MEQMLDTLKPGALLPLEDVLVIFTTVGYSTWLNELPTKRRKVEGGSAADGGASSNANISNDTAISADGGHGMVVSKEALVAQLVSEERGVGMHMHSQLLRDASPYFAARLSSEWRDRCCRDVVSTELGHAVLVLPVQEGQLGAALELLKLIISGSKLGQAVKDDAELLLQVALLANELQAKHCISACADAMAAVKPDKLCEAFVCQVLQLPETVLQQAGYLELRKTCVRSLLQAYEHAESLLGQQHMREQFRQLPFEAVHAWAAADAVDTCTEDAILVLLNLWMHGPRGPEQSGASPEQRQYQQKQLSACVRVCQLSKWHLTALLMGAFPWFQCPHKEQHLGRAAYVKMMRISVSASLWDGGPALNGFPGSWLLPHRRRDLAYTVKDYKGCCMVEIGRAELTAAINMVMESEDDTEEYWTGPYTYYRGMVWQAGCRLRYIDSTAGGRAQAYASLVAYLRVCPGQLSLGVDEALLPPVHACIESYVLRRWKPQERLKYPTIDFFLPAGQFALGMGLHQPIRTAADVQQNAWEEDKLHIEVWFNAKD